MLDGWARTKIDPLLNRIAHSLASSGVSANAVSWFGWLLGILAAAAITQGWLALAILLIIASRIADGVDGAVASLNGKTGYGGFLDIVLDFFFYGAIPLGFAIQDPASNALPAAALIFSFYVNGASFLAYAVLAERNKLETEARGEKSLYFTTGLAEATETIAVFLAMCLLPQWFSILAWAFAAVCIYTAASRIILAGRTFAGLK